MPQSGGAISRWAAICSSAERRRSRTSSTASTRLRVIAMTPQDDLGPGETLEQRGIIQAVRVLDRDRIDRDLLETVGESPSSSRSGWPHHTCTPSSVVVGTR